MEDFENKIDKIASGADKGDEDSWINKLYNEFKPGEGGQDESFDDQDGLEPPMLDETWGIREEDTNDKDVKKKMHSKDEEFKKYVDGV